MKPAQAIAQLDRHLAKHGQDVTLLRWLASDGNPRPKLELLGVRASIRPLKPEQMVGDVDETFSNVIVSPSGLATMLPLKKGDIVVTADGKHRSIEFPGQVLVDNTLVRINLLIGG